MLKRFRGWVFPAAAAFPSPKSQLVSVLSTFICLLILSYLSGMVVPAPGHLVLVASMGAAALLVFVIPNSPLAQPYPLVVGHLVPTFVGVTVVNLVPDFYLAAALTVSLGLAGMYLTNSMHPPGAAASLVPVIMGNESIGGYEFLVFPVLLNVVILFIVGVIVNRFILKRDYPITPKSEEDETHKHHDPSPLSRLGISSEDISAAIKANNAYLNISAGDLDKIYDYAQMSAYTRHFGAIRCRDIMSRDVITVEYGTSLEDAWALLRYHKIKLLPVIDRAQRVIGVLSLVDYLKRANLKAYKTFAEELVEFIRKTTTNHSEKPEVVGQIMVAPAFTVREDELISALVPLLSDKGLHHVPVVNDEKRLIGIVTQSDLIAALYRGAFSA